MMNDELRSPYITPPASISPWPRDHAYDDIIMLPHHVSEKHSPMSMLQRAAQFSPFAALTGYDDAVKETARLTDGFMELDSDRIMEIDEKLQEIQSDIENGKGARVMFTFFKPDSKKDGGAYVDKFGEVKRLDNVEKMVLLKDGTRIPIPLIFDVEIARE